MCTMCGLSKGMHSANWCVHACTLELAPRSQHSPHIALTGMQKQLICPDASLRAEWCGISVALRGAARLTPGIDEEVYT